MSARPPADERVSPEDQKPDEKREQPSFRPSKQDPFYLGLREDLRKARRTARRNIDNACRRQRRAADPDHRDKCRAQSHGLSLQDYRAMLERQGNICGICKTPGKPLCVDHCHATGKVRGLLCRDCNLGLGNYKDNPVFTRAATVYLEAARRDDGNQRSALGKGSIRFHDLVFGARRRRTRVEAWKLQIRRLFRGFYGLKRRRGEISRESPGKFRAGHMPASSVPPGLPLNSAPWAEALIGGQAVVGPAGHPQEAPGTDEQRPAIPVGR